MCTFISSFGSPSYSGSAHFSDRHLCLGFTGIDHVPTTEVVIAIGVYTVTVVTIHSIQTPLLSAHKLTPLDYSRLKRDILVLPSSSKVLILNALRWVSKMFFFYKKLLCFLIASVSCYIFTSQGIGFNGLHNQ